MTAKRLVQFLGGVIAAAAIAHVLVAAAAVWAIYSLYPHRIFNVRSWADAGNERFHLVGTFLRETTRNRAVPVIAFAGSSVAYGYPWHERYVFSRLFAERHSTRRVVNASIIAADITGVNDFIICGAWRNHLKLDALIIEMPVVNTTSYLTTLRRAGQTTAASGACAPGPEDISYLELVSTRARGIGWIPFLWNRTSGETKEIVFQFATVPVGYFTSRVDFESVRPDFVGRIMAALTNARQVATSVYAFPSPVFLGGLAEIGEDTAAVKEQLRTALEACAAVESVRCFDPSSLYFERGYYQNLTHLNQAGHRALAALLEAQFVAD
jgi:hypothetical protein